MVWLDQVVRGALHYLHPSLLQYQAKAVAFFYSNIFMIKKVIKMKTIPNYVSFCFTLSLYSLCSPLLFSNFRWVG